MSIIPCPECKKEISSNNNICPYCRRETYFKGEGNKELNDHEMQGAKEVPPNQPMEDQEKFNPDPPAKKPRPPVTLSTGERWIGRLYRLNWVWMVAAFVIGGGGVQELRANHWGASPNVRATIFIFTVPMDMGKGKMTHIIISTIHHRCPKYFESVTLIQSQHKAETLT